MLTHSVLQPLCSPDGLHPQGVGRGRDAVSLGSVQVAHLGQVDGVIGVDGEVLAEEDTEGWVGEGRLSNLTEVTPRNN